jgi:cyclase
MAAPPAGSRPGPYTQGLHELGDGLFAYLQPDGSWGWSNAGLVGGDGASLLVDTLFDLDLTAAMLDALRPVTSTRPISTLVNTHANGDHCYGNALVPGAEIVASQATATEMDEVPPALLHAMVTSDLGDEVLNDYVRRIFGAFRLDGIEVVPPTRTFCGSLGLDVAGTVVELIEAGPAHTAGDVVVHVPSAATAFVGDLAFIGGTPIVWAGPLSNWCDAIDMIGGLGVTTVVPGHGPVCGMPELVAVRDYLAHVDAEATARFDAGMTAEEATLDIDLGAFADWGERERIAVNVATVYRHLDPTAPAPDVLTLFRRMAAYQG